MNSTFLPVVTRELKVWSARAGLQWIRLAVAGVAVLTLLQWFNTSPVIITGSSAGPAAFEMLGRVAFVLALAGILVTADTLSRERREGTLGLLFLTTLTGRDVVLGKFAATGLVAFHALLGFTPVLVLPLLTGGVSGGDVTRLALALLNVLFVALAAGLWVSSWAHSQSVAILGSFGALAALATAPFLLPVLLQSHSAMAVAVVSPVYAYFHSSAVIYSAAPGAFWLSLALAHGWGWLLLGATVWGLSRNWRTLPEPRAVPAPSVAARRLLAAPRVLIPSRSNRHHVYAPVARAVLRLRGQPGLAWLAAAIAVIGLWWNASVMARSGGAAWTAWSVSVVFELVSLALFAWVTGRFFYEARRTGELELLLCTPVGARGILREQRLALTRLLRGPVYLVVLATVPAAAAGISSEPNAQFLTLLYGLGLMLNAGLSVVAASWVGLWLGGRANHPLMIMGGTVGLVELLPLGAVVLFLLLPWPALGDRGPVAGFVILLTPVFFVFKNFAFIAWARHRLRTEYRADDGFMRIRRRATALRSKGGGQLPL